MTIIGFLVARLDEEERAYDVPAFIALDGGSPQGWGTRGACRICGMVTFDGPECATAAAYCDHLERVHQRSRRRAECAAIRSLVELHGGDVQSLRTQSCEECGQFAPCHTLRLLAAPFARHPAFHDEWRS